MTRRTGRRSAVTIVVLYPALLGTYGDGGNAKVLQRRCQWRGEPAEVLPVHFGQAVPTTGDLYLVGGGEDGAQLAVMRALAEERGARTALGRAVDGGAQILAVCAGLQLLGESFTDADGHQTAGLGLLDIRTGRLATRAVGELLAEPDRTFNLPTLSGFENHGGHTVLGPSARPLAQVTAGTGNGPAPTGKSAGEGVMTPSIVATYLHGPVLARNPALADLLLSRVLNIPRGDLAPIDDADHDALRGVVGVPSAPRAGR